ncbi:hypothetical protein B0J11DRAFT_194231 [Dendryphion nanum]|uniref:Uncharacterized protein n=1 Tax=Dendryphion nanum TaxID=256645 RepID=A0A9P9I9B3_9PLEO|nr:hypothetical protein B0J11DRAFT_194231 [Dendryphion nanum]
MSQDFFTSNIPQGYHTVRSRGGGPFTVDNPPSAGSSSGMGRNSAGSPQFDIFEWHSTFQHCQRYFLDHAQHDNNVQAVAALVNIQLPFQWTSNPIVNSSGPLQHTPGPGVYNLSWPRSVSVASSRDQPAPAWVSLVPFIRRLIITGMDREGVMHGFFGDDWRKGVGPVHECERRNYLFVAKSGGWSRVKIQYDMSPYESVPFLKPLQDVRLAEIEAAEEMWSQWLAIEDWMVGPRAPDAEDHQPQEPGRPLS